MRVVIDTNVVVSALLKPDSAPALVLQKVLTQKNRELLLSPSLLAEYEEVLTRKKFINIFSQAAIRSLIVSMAKESVFIIPFAIVDACEDADDNMVLALALDGLADCIVSGDNHLLKLHPFKTIPILNSTDFLAWMDGKST
jgi:uncharacterized protein